MVGDIGPTGDLLHSLAPARAPDCGPLAGVTDDLGSSSSFMSAVIIT